MFTQAAEPVPAAGGTRGAHSKLSFPNWAAAGSYNTHRHTHGTHKPASQVPLRPVAGDEEDSGLCFAAGSHRDFALNFWHDISKLGDLSSRGYRIEGTGACACKVGLPEVGGASWQHQLQALQSIMHNLAHTNKHTNTMQTPGRMELGDVSWHHGWTLHAAGPQPRRSPPRLALAVSYFADGARLLDTKGDPSFRCVGALPEGSDSDTVCTARRRV